MVRILLGLLKGGVIGAGIGIAAFKLGISSGVLSFVAYGLVGALVGIVAGRPPWRQDTLWTSLLKGIFGFAIGLGLYWGARKLLGGAHLPIATSYGAPDRPLVEVPFLLAPMIGAIWGIFVELDDSSGAAARKQQQATTAEPRR
jgi:hypothetical protein